jgi:hypothetical protein
MKQNEGGKDSGRLTRNARGCYFQRTGFVSPTEIALPGRKDPKPLAALLARASAAALLLLLPAAGAEAQAQAPRPLLQRLGGTLDSSERAYFGFFPMLSGFSSASLLAEGDSLRFVVRRPAGGTGTDTAIALSPEETGMLETLIDDYESFVREYPEAMDESTAAGWTRDEKDGRVLPLIERGILRLHRVAPDDRPLVRVRTADRRVHDGRLLAYTDSALLLFDDGGRFHWRNPDEDVIVILYRNIRTLARRVPGSFWSGALPGAAVATIIASILFSDLSGCGTYSCDIGFPSPGILLLASAAAGGLPGALLAGLVTSGSRDDVAFPGTSLPSAWDANPAIVDSLFILARRSPPEWTSRHAFRAGISGGPRADTSAAGNLPPAPAAPPDDVWNQRSPIPWIAVDYAMHYYDIWERALGVTAGISLGADIPLIHAGGSRPLLSLRAVVGTGMSYSYGELSLLATIAGALFVSGSIADLSMREHEFAGDRRWPTDVYIDRDGLAKRLFGYCGLGVRFARSFLELRAGVPFSPVLVTHNLYPYSGEPENERRSFVSVLVRYGWRM